VAGEQPLSKHFEPRVAPKAPSPNEPSFFRSVALPPLCLLGVWAAIVLVIYAATTPSEWNNLGLTVAIVSIVAFDIFLFTFPFLLLCWIARRQQQSMIGVLVSGACYLRLNVLATWAILISIVGIVNACFPWAVVAVKGVIVEFKVYISALTPHETPVRIVAVLFMIAGLLAVATANSRSARPWCTAGCLIIGLAIFFATGMVLDGVSKMPTPMIRSEFASALRLETADGIPMSATPTYVPYVSAGLAACLMICGVFDLRGLLANRSPASADSAASV
jgi:hypothetical protein